MAIQIFALRAMPVTEHISVNTKWLNFLIPDLSIIIVIIKIIPSGWSVGRVDAGNPEGVEFE